MKTQKNRKAGSVVSRTSALLLLLFVLSAAATACSGGKAAYQKLTEPDRIHAYWDGQEQVFTKNDPQYSEIYNVIQKSWDGAKKNGLLNMIQLIYLEKESAPEDPSRIVFEYDTPIRWQISSGDEASGEEANTYIFFLNWDMNAAVICQDEDYEKRAFFPEMVIESAKILEILGKAR